MQSASECKHFVYLSIQNGTYVMVCELIAATKNSLCYEIELQL